MTRTDLAADVRDQAIHILRTTPAVLTQYGMRPLGETDAERAVAALAAAGLLRENPALPGRPQAPLTFDEAQMLYRRQVDEEYTVVISQEGTVRLARVAYTHWEVSSHRGEHYRGDDLAAAVEAYNAAVLPSLREKQGE